MMTGGMCPDTFKAVIPISPAWMIPELCRSGEILGMKFDPKHIPDSVEFDGWKLSGDYVRVAQTLHPEDEIARYEGPVFIIHGDEDETVPFMYATRALKLYKNAKLFTIHGDDHCFTRHLDEMADALRDIFKAELKNG